MPLRTDPDLADLLGSFAPAICGAFAATIRGMNAGAVAQSLSVMRDDPTEVLKVSHEGELSRWAGFEAGGPLTPDHVEVHFGPALAHVTDSESAAAVLDILAQAPQRPVSATKLPWSAWWRPPGLPATLISALPFPPTGGIFLHLVVGATSLAQAAQSLGQPETVEKMVKHLSGKLLHAWLTENKTRALAEHPGFDMFVQRPSAGQPGLCVIRCPAIPFTPLFPASCWTERYGTTVFETDSELAQIERYYRTPGASVFFEAPIVRNRPPPSERPATLAGGIKDGGVSVLKLPWANAGFVAVSTVQSAALNRMPRDVRNALHRGRYWRANAPDLDALLTKVEQSFPGVRGNIVPSVALAQDPRIQVAWTPTADGRPRHIVVGTAADGRDACALFLMSMTARNRRREDPAYRVPGLLAIGPDCREIAEAVALHGRSAFCPAAGDGPAALTREDAAQAGFVVVDPDAAAFLVRALPDSDPHSEDEGRPAVCLVALCGDERDVTTFETCDELSVKLDANLMVVVGRPDMPDDADVPLSAAVRAVEAARPGRIRVCNFPPPPDLPLAALAAEMFSRLE